MECDFHYVALLVLFDKTLNHFCGLDLHVARTGLEEGVVFVGVTAGPLGFPTAVNLCMELGRKRR